MPRQKPNWLLVLFILIIALAYILHRAMQLHPHAR